MNKATNLPPQDARLVYSLNLLENRPVFWRLQIISTLSFVLFGALFAGWTALVRPAWQQTFSKGIVIQAWGVLWVILIFVVFISLHELIHGAFFWIFTRRLPKLGIGAGYAFAAAPGWFFPRRQYLLVALSPLVLLSLLGMALVAVVPLAGVTGILLGTVVNASGAVGDLWIVYRVVREPAEVVIEDLGDGIKIYSVD